MTGLLAALTSTVGEALGEIGGRLLTRLTAPVEPRAQVSRGSSNASSVDGVNITLSGGALFGAAVTPGTRFRLLSGGNAGAEATVISIGGGGATALVGAGLGGAFASRSWEVERPAATVLPVESTLYWQDAGECFLSGVRHRYTGRTVSSLTGITHYDGADWQPGVSRRAETRAVVADYTRNFSAIDRLRRRFFVELADSDGLNDIGANHGRPRREGLEDTEVYRAYLRATMYAPTGTRLALFQLLDALVGVGEWEAFEDFTSSTEDLARVYVRLLAEDPEDPAGQWFLEAPVRRAPSSSTTIVVPEAPLRMGSVTLASETSARVVASGSGASTTNGTALTGAPGTFPARIRRGDTIEALDGPLAGQRAIVATNVSTSALTLGPVTGHGEAGFGSAAAGFRWRVVRDVTDTRFALPSADTALEYDGDPGTAAWAWQGSTTEAVGAVITADATQGDRLDLGVAVAGLTGYYLRNARIQPESTGELEVLVRPNLAAVLDAADGRQWCVQMRDGERALAAGLFFVDGVVAALGFINATTGAVIGTPVSIPSAFQRVGLRKRGRQAVELLLDGRVVARAVWTAFVAATETDFRCGCLSTAVAGRSDVRELSWHVETPTDYWAARSAVGTAAASPSRNLGNLGGIVLVGDVGRVVMVSGGDARNAGGGTANGEWEIEARVDANTATVVGRTKPGASFRLGHPARIFLPAEFALMFPDALGHQIQVLDGDNAGTYTIARLLDASFTDLATFAPDSYLQTSDGEAPARERATVVEVSNPPVGGFGDPDGEYLWRLRPVFPADAALLVQVSDAGTVAGTTLTLRQALPILSPLPAVDVTYTTVLSGHTEALSDDDSIATPRWPAYLYDGWGSARPILQLEGVAEGVELNLDDLQRDAAGLHIVPE